MMQSAGRTGGRRTQRSLQVLLAILLGSIVGCVTIALALVFVVREDRDVRERVALETASTAASTAALLQTQFEQQLQALAMVAAEPGLAADLEAGHAQQLTARLEAVAPANPDFSRLTVIDAAGRVVANNSADKSSIGRSFADQSHIQDALSRSRATIGVPRRAIGQGIGIPVLPIGVPIVGPNGQGVGVLQATADLGRLNADVGTIRVGRTGYVSIATADGLLVAHPDGERLLTTATNTDIEMVDPSNPLAQLQQLASPGRALWFESTVTMPSTGWQVQARMPVAEAFESLWERVVTAGIVSVSTSCLAVALGVVFARRIAAPLDQLVNVVKQVGEKPSIAVLPETGMREVAQLAAAFGAMHERLAERTGQQQAAEAALRQQADSLHALMGLSQSLVSTLSLDDVLHEVTHSAATLLSAPFASFWVVDLKTRTIQLRACSDDVIAQLRTVRDAGFGDGVVGWVAEHCESQIIDDIFADGRTRDLGWWRDHDLRSVLTVPVLDNGTIVGVLSVAGREPFRLDAVAQDVLTMFLAQAAIAIRNASLYASQAASRAATELAEVQFRALIEAAPDAVIIRAGSGDLLFANQRAQALFGATESELLGSSLESAVPERTRAAYRATHTYLLAHPGEVRTLSGPDICAVRRDGVETPIEVSATCVMTPDGPRRIGILRDISERHALDRMKERFVSIVSHELRTPLTPVIGLAQLLSTTPLSPQQTQMVETIERSSQHLLEIVNDLLDYSKIQAGQLRLEAVGLDLRALVKETVDLQRARAGEKGLRLSWQVSDDVPERVQGDPVRLRQVLSNLVVNALKFTHVGEVSVRARLAEQTPTSVLVRLEVVDSGIGIDAATSARLFEPFVQASSTTTREYGGTGLGLAISKQLAGLMGGQIGVESAAGQGSTFWFTVQLGKSPASQRPAAVAGLPERLQPARTSNTADENGRAARRGLAALPPPSRMRDVAPILVVEDSPMNRLTVLSMLQHLGYRGHAVDNGQRAVEAVEAGTYAAVLMDCQMPVMDGYEATAQIRRRETGGTTLPIIAMTASAMLSDRDRCLAAGMDDYIVKPLEPTRLASALARWTGPDSHGSVPGDAPDRSPDVSPDAILNLGHLSGLATVHTADGATLVEKMIGYFVASCPGHLRQIDAAIAHGDLPLVARIAHKLTGESATVGASAVGQIAREIELLAQAGTSPDETGDMPRLKQAISAATTALQQYQATVSASPAARA